uniref:Uncharacterized protein n=1 Tax=Romanomermis culicivorax TaxID=13658 RepID=A0A915KDK2_ROMCU
MIDHPMLLAAPEPSDDDLLQTSIFDLNIAKLLMTVPTPARTEPPTAADLTVSVTQINDFLKLTLDHISSLAPAPLEELTPVQPIDMDTRMNTTTSDQMLTDIPEDTTTDNATAIDIAPPMPAMDIVPSPPPVDPSIYLATPGMLPGPPMIATVAAASASADCYTITANCSYKHSTAAATKHLNP